MIAVVCLNPALDVTHHVPAVDWAGVNRPSAVHARPGGKGLNVARTLHALGVDVLVMGLAGGITGAGVEAALGRLGIPAVFTQITGETRRTFTVVDGRGGTALFNEAGPEVKTSEFAQFRARYDKVLAGSAAVVLSGSLPPGLAAETYASLIETAAAAALAHGLVLGRPWDERLRHAVALGAATAAAPAAGEFRPADYASALPQVTVRRVTVRQAAVRQAAGHRDGVR